MIGSVVVGALAGLDRTAFGQTFLAHPIVCGSLSAWWAGHPVDGIRAAVVIGLVSAVRVPVGEVRVRDWTSAAVVLPWCVGPEPDGARWGAALLVSLLVAIGGGRLIEATRVLHGRRIRAFRAAAGTRGAVRLHLGLTALSAVRGALTCTVAVVVGSLALEALVPRLPDPERSALSGLWALAPWGVLPLLWRLHAGPGATVRTWATLGVSAAVALAATWWMGGTP